MVGLIKRISFFDFLIHPKILFSLLNIWGVMLFLRLSWVVGQAGIGM